MMRVLTWIAVGFWGMVLCSAVGARLGVGHAMPDIAAMVLTFVALRREAPVVALTSFALGYIMGRTALAPDGLHACALVAVSLGIYLSAGNLASRGTMFFALCSGAAVVGYNALMLALMAWQQGVGVLGHFNGMALVPSAILTFLLALLCHHPMMWLDKKLAQDKRVGLAWR